jgi:hypothetical protein
MQPMTTIPATTVVTRTSTETVATEDFCISHEEAVVLNDELKACDEKIMPTWLMILNLVAVGAVVTLSATRR